MVVVVWRLSWLCLGLLLLLNDLGIRADIDPFNVVVVPFERDGTDLGLELANVDGFLVVESVDGLFEEFIELVDVLMSVDGLSTEGMNSTEALLLIMHSDAEEGVLGFLRSPEAPFDEVDDDTLSEVVELLHVYQKMQKTELKRGKQLEARSEGNFKLQLQAVSHLRTARLLQPFNVLAIVALAAAIQNNLALMANAEEPLQLLNLAVGLEPDNAAAHFHLARSLALAGHNDALRTQELEHLKRAAELEPGNYEGNYLMNMALWYREQGRCEEAFDIANGLLFGDMAGRFGRTEQDFMFITWIKCSHAVGRTSEALSIGEHALSNGAVPPGKPTETLHFALASALDRALAACVDALSEGTAEERQCQQLADGAFAHASLANAHRSSEKRAHVHTLLAKLRTQQRRYSHALLTHATTSDWVRPGPAAVGAASGGVYEQQRSGGGGGAGVYFTPEIRNLTPVLIVGVPRSGTSVTEQMLGMHGRAHPTGESLLLGSMGFQIPVPETGVSSSSSSGEQEGGGDEAKAEAVAAAAAAALPREMLNELAARILTDLRSDAVANGASELALSSDGEQFLLTKNPFDFAHIGLFSLLFPGAPVLVMERDPRDVGWSNFLQEYVAEDHLTAYTSHLDDIAVYMREYEGLMEHWRAAPAVGRISLHTVDYQQLVRSPESVMKETLSFLGLDWDPLVLRFFESKRTVYTASVEQVRQPLYSTSVDKWKWYKHHLVPLMRGLGKDYCMIDGVDVCSVSSTRGGGGAEL